MQDIAIGIIRQELEKIGIKVIKIILFGSRARGNFKEDSDWDLFVVIDGEIEPYQMRETIGEIYKKLAKLEGSYEIILKKQSVFEEMRELIGCISYEADKEGIIIWRS